MPYGAITGHIDVALVVLYAFWIFFAGLIFYLRREDRREGYPMEATGQLQKRRRGDGDHVFPLIPAPKFFWRPSGPVMQAPRARTDSREIRTAPTEAWSGAPFVPTGDPLKDGVGPASWVEREERPETLSDGRPAIVPARLTDYKVEREDYDPRGMTVLAGDEAPVGTVEEIWVDLSEPHIRYLQVGLAGAPGRTDERHGERDEEGDREAHHPAPAAAGPLLLPMNFARIDGRRRRVRVEAIMSHHFADVPRTASGEQVTKREEDRIMAYYGGGKLYATPARLGPLL